MILRHPTALIVIGVLLMCFGVIMPLLMVIHTVKSTFFLNFLSYFASVGGFLMGIIGVAMYRGTRGKKHDEDESDHNEYL